MSVTPSSTIVGIFRDRSMAEQAVEALYNAGFTREQTSFLAPGTSGGFVENLKSIFTGTTPSSGNFSDNLTNMGLSDDDASYYSNEYNKGNSILAVRAQGREPEALNIMHQYGAYNSKMEQGFFNETTNDMQQPSDLSQQSPSAIWGEQHHAQNWQTQPQYHTDEQYPSIEAQHRHTATEGDEDDIADEKTQPVASRYSSEPLDSHVNEGSPEQGIDYWATQAHVDTPQHEGEYQATTSDNSTSDAIEHDAGQQTTQTIPVTPGQLDETQAPQSVSASTEHVDEKQQLQEHLQTLQQQLREAKAQLQAAKQQEDQLRLTREREQELQAARQQLQQVQTELQATLAELQETQSRITQYQ